MELEMYTKQCLKDLKYSTILFLLSRLSFGPQKKCFEKKPKIFQEKSTSPKKLMLCIEELKPILNYCGTVNNKLHLEKISTHAQQL